MAHTDVEIKARCSELGKVRKILKNENADFKGIDHQTDTYFKVSEGRLKLREGNIENALIFYRRPDEAGPKKTQVFLYHVRPDSQLKELLVNALGVLVTVKKKREICFIDNVKFHIDAVDHLGSFIEIEAIDTTGQLGAEKLRQQCEHYMQLLGVAEEDLVDCSYSDMLMNSCTIRTRRNAKRKTS